MALGWLLPWAAQMSSVRLLQMMSINAELDWGFKLPFPREVPHFAEGVQWECREITIVLIKLRTTF